MVGLKKFWILLTLCFFAACVPQTKQTECSANEAFNASLRTCVPVVGGPSSFIKVDSYTPMFAQTRSKSDSTTLTFTISVSNPYNQSYSIAWERVFNGSPVSICTNSFSCSTTAYYLGTVLGEIGTHLITAKVTDGTGAVVDTHSFELKVNELPKPVINTATIVPATYAFDVYPTDANVPFSFLINNNGANLSVVMNYRTVWTIVKNGSTIHTETDTFSDLSTSGTNTTYLGTSTTPFFDPNGGIFGVGSYVIRATVHNDIPGEVIGEHQWNVNVKQPPLANVTNITLPAPGVTTVAHNGIDYNDYPSLSWIYGSGPSQPQFCVTVDDRDGTYPTDGQSIQVRWYLNGVGSEIYSTTTLDTPGTQTVCLADGVFDTSLLRFTNASSTVPQMHKVTARLFDMATSLEFQRSNVVPSTGSYPIEWNVLVNPINTAPVITFAPPTGLTGCTTSGAFSQINCAVNQGTDFTVSFAVTDDFYTPGANPGNFQWDVRLKLNSANLSTPPFPTSCTKAFGATTPAAVGNVWSCTLRVPHYRDTGALHPSGPFEVVATLQDQNSPIGGGGLPANSLSWTINVTETNSPSSNTALSPQTALPGGTHIARETPLPIVYFDPSGSNAALETETVTFRLNVRDPELDDFNYAIYRCGSGSSTSSCLSPTLLAGSSLTYLRGMFPAVSLPFADTVNTDYLQINAFQWTLPETLLLQVGEDVDTLPGTSRPVYFRVDVFDRPSVLPSLQVDSEIFTLYVRNYNPRPVINEAGATPVPNTSGSPYTVFSGFPFSIDPGTVTDSSSDSSENTISYQWFASANGSTWSALAPPSTNERLTWTPDQNPPAAIQLKMCVGDRAAANPIQDPSVPGSNCTSGTWHITPRSFIGLPTPTVNFNSEVAVWQDIDDQDPLRDVVYTAYIGSDSRIYVNKTVRTNLFVLDSTSFETVSFNAIDGGSATSITNLSLAGTRDSLYIAYLATTTTNMIPRLRRIDKSFTPGSVEKTNLSHKGKFGFGYAQYSINEAGCASAPTSCTKVDATSSSDASISFAAGMDTGFSIEINGVTFTAVAGLAPGPTDLCDSSTCSATDVAANLAAKINLSTHPNLKGITASAGSGTVTLTGMAGYDSLDWDGSNGTSSLVVSQNGMGKIFVVGSYWFIPIINASLPGADQNNISIISGLVDQKLQNTGFISLADNDVLTTLGKVAAFDSDLNLAGNLIIASISSDIADAGRAKLSRFALSGVRDFEPASGTAQVSIFGSYLFEKIHVAADKDNNSSIFVLGKERTIDGGEYQMGRHASNFSGTALEYPLSTQVSPSDSSPTYISDALLGNPVIIAVPYSSEARVFFTSGSAPRMARWKADNTLSCGECFPVGLTGTTSKIAVSQVVRNTTLGVQGYVSSENVKDTVFMFTNYLNGANNHPQVGHLNVETEAIHSTTVDTVNHLWRPPFAK